MRLYVKPELRIEAFDVEDVITASGGSAFPSPVPNGEGGANGEAAPVLDGTGEPAAAALKTTLFPESTIADPSGAFQHEVTGGNPIQEGLNNLYENFLSHF